MPTCRPHSSELLGYLCPPTTDYSRKQSAARLAMQIRCEDPASAALAPESTHFVLQGTQCPRRSPSQGHPREQQPPRVLPPSSLRRYPAAQVEGSPAQCALGSTAPPTCTSPGFAISLVSVIANISRTDVAPQPLMSHIQMPCDLTAGNPCIFPTLRLAVRRAKLLAG